MAEAVALGPKGSHALPGNDMSGLPREDLRLLRTCWPLGPHRQASLSHKGISPAGMDHGLMQRDQQTLPLEDISSGTQLHPTPSLMRCLLAYLLSVCIFSFQTC